MDSEIKTKKVANGENESVNTGKRCQAHLKNKIFINKNRDV